MMGSMGEIRKQVLCKRREMGGIVRDKLCWREWCFQKSGSGLGEQITLLAYDPFFEEEE